jgi:hypothetical protein
LISISGNAINLYISFFISSLILFIINNTK